MRTKMKESRKALAWEKKMKEMAEYFNLGKVITDEPNNEQQIKAVKPSGKYICNICNKEISPSLLAEHFRTIHGYKLDDMRKAMNAYDGHIYVGLHICYWCGLKFEKGIDLIKHFLNCQNHNNQWRKIKEDFIKNFEKEFEEEEKKRANKFTKEKVQE